MGIDYNRHSGGSESNIPNTDRLSSGNGSMPVLLPTRVTNGAAPGVRYRIEGELLPALHLELDGSLPVFFEHHVILWKQPNIDVRLKKLRGAFKRVLSGMPIFMTEAVGAGQIAFSRDNPGHVFPMHLKPGATFLIREHQFLAATGNLEYTFERAGGISSMLFGSQGFFVDRFTASGGEAVVWVHAHGNAFEVNLAPGEVIDVEPGAWIYRDDSVGYTQKVFGLKTGIFGGGGNLVFNRFTGPGRVGLQSGYYSEAALTGAATGAAAGGLLGGAGGAVRGGGIGGLLGGAFGNGGN
ncbi:MAG: AIM24 family protein [Frankia sp.]